MYGYGDSTEQHVYHTSQQAEDDLGDLLDAGTATEDQIADAVDGLEYMLLAHVFLTQESPLARRLRGYGHIYGHSYEHDLRDEGDYDCGWQG